MIFAKRADRKRTTENLGKTDQVDDAAKSADDQPNESVGSVSPDHNDQVDQTSNLDKPKFGQKKSDKTKRSFSQRVSSMLIETVAVVAGAALISVLLRAFVFQMFLIPSESMETTLQRDDRVMAVQFMDFKRGDVVVFKDPAAWLSEEPVKRNFGGRILEMIGLLPASDAGYLVKRVIGMPGDRVKCCDGQGYLLINGKPIDEKEYLYSSNGITVSPSDITFDVVVPEDRIFVMGDHRNASGDSRCHLSDKVKGQPDGMSAFVPVNNVVGPVKMIVAPFSRWQRIKTPQAFKEVPNPSAPAPKTPQINDAGRGC